MYSIMDSQNRPIIGILCIDVSAKLYQLYGPTVKSYIAASYVKFVEFSGARAVPIWIGRDEAFYRNIMKKINGILMPGGAVFFNSMQIQKPEQTNDCVRSAGLIYRIAVEMNENGIYFPLLGICLGYELLLYHSANENEVRRDCTSLSTSMVLEFERDFRSSKLFENLNTETESVMRIEPFAYHFHKYCITKDDLYEFGIADLWRVTSSNRDDNGMSFISTIEHVKYPIYGMQFHPEKVIFEWTLSDQISHSENSVKCVQYFANFFISECRKNANCFDSEEDANLHLIYNFPVEFTGLKDAKLLQCYLFKENSDYAKSEKIAEVL